MRTGTHHDCRPSWAARAVRNVTHHSTAPIPPQKYPPELTVAGPNLRYDYEPDLVRDLLELLVPSNMLLVVSSWDFKGKTDKVRRGSLRSRVVVSVLGGTERGEDRARKGVGGMASTA